jgi:glutamate-ammonia-ligase adenylyltransferase
MQLDQLRECLDSPEDARALLAALNLCDPRRGWENLCRVANTLGLEVFGQVYTLLGRFLPRCADPDMALNNLERFLANPAAVPLLPQLLEGRARTLDMLVQLFATSQTLSDVLARNPDSLDMLRVPLRRTPSQAEMQIQLQAEVDAAFEDSAVLRAFRRFRERQLLRIGTNDIVRERSLEEITRDLTRVADAAIEVAMATALRSLMRR